MKIFNQEPCGTCRGKGYVPKLDVMKAKTAIIRCPDCAGQGAIPTDPIQEGAVSRQKQCIVYYWNVIRGGKVAATLILHISPILSQSSTKAAPEIAVEIIRMHVSPRYRRRGLMKEILDRAIHDPKIKIVEAEWDAMSGMHRNFLLKYGFVQEGEMLAWRKQ